MSLYLQDYCFFDTTGATNTSTLYSLPFLSDFAGTQCEALDEEVELPDGCVNVGDGASFLWLAYMAPTQTPSQAPSEAPSAEPSTKPSTVPSATPSKVPTVVPSTTPTRTPTIGGTAVPSVVPSLAPTVQTAATFTFTSVVTVDGLATDSLTTDEQTVISNSAAVAMNLTLSSTHYVSADFTSDRRRSLSVQQQTQLTVHTEDTTFTADVVLSTFVNMLAYPDQEPEAVYAQLAALLIGAANDDTLTVLIVDFAHQLGATGLYNTTVLNAITNTPLIVYPPTDEPTATPSIAPTATTGPTQSPTIRPTRAPVPTGESDSGGGGGLSSGAIIGIVVAAGVIGLFLIGTCYYQCLKRSNVPRANYHENDDFLAVDGTTATSSGAQVNSRDLVSRDDDETRV